MFLLKNLIFPIFYAAKAGHLNEWRYLVHISDFPTKKHGYMVRGIHTRNSRGRPLAFGVMAVSRHDILLGALSP